MGRSGHDHHHHHHHSASGNIALALALNLTFSLIELVGGWWTGSLAVIADAIHDLGDSLSLALAWFLEKLAKKAKDESFSYGYHRFSLLSALLSSFIILFGSGFIIYETIGRFNQPILPHSTGMMGLAFLGILVNGLAAFKLSKGETQNEKVLTWHLMEDLLGWVAVLLGAIVIYWTSWTWIDPALAVGLSLYIMWNVVKHLRYTLHLFFQGQPKNFSPLEFQNRVSQIPGVVAIHDLHAWSLDGERNILSCHLIVEKGLSHEEVFQLKEKVRHYAKEFGKFHVTIETEITDFPCLDDCDTPHEH